MTHRHILFWTRVGVDIDKDAVSEARSISGLQNMFCTDITSPRVMSGLQDEKFDYAIFGEVVEHIGNPVYFLKRFLDNYGHNVGEVVITVPNALRGGNIKNILRSRESINSDHRFFFTPYTIAKIAWDAGLTPVSVEMATFSPTGRGKSALLNCFPLLAENIIYVGTPDVCVRQDRLV